MGIRPVLPCCPDLEPPEDFLDVVCIQGAGDNEYRVVLVSVINPTENSTIVTYQVCRCEGDISHVSFEICPNGPTPLEDEENGPDILPPGAPPDNLPYTSARFNFQNEEVLCNTFELIYNVFFTEEDLAEREVTIFTGNETFTGTILLPCFE